jgi:hypothetical protein
MIILPHIFTLQYLKRQCEFLRAHPDQLEFLLSAYKGCEVNGVYGDEYIQKAIDWFRTHEINFALGSRLDTDKLPRIDVTYEGGSEEDQVIGDYAETVKIKIPEKTYGTFSVKSFEDGTLILSGSQDYRRFLWRGVVVRNGKFSASIQEIYPFGDDIQLVLSKKASLETEQLQNWLSVSPVTSKTRTVGTSLDRVAVKVYLHIQGDPDLCDTISMIIRYLLKQARLFFEANGLYENKMSHSALSLSSDYAESQVWVVEFTISGLLQDKWIMVESVPGDKLELDFIAKSCKPQNEDVKLWPPE